MVLLANAANSKPTASKKKATPASWKPGQSGNPKGRPKEGQSWASIYAEVGEMSAEQLAKAYGDNDLGRVFRIMPKGIQMKYLVVGRTYAQLMFDVHPALLKEIHERMDGKVPDQLTFTGQVNVEGFDKALDKVYGKHKSG